MRPVQRFAPFVLAFGALIPACAEATGSITRVSSNPSPAAVGTEVTITLAGSGTCQTYVTFGDNQKSARLTQLPATVKHTYASAGKFVIRSLSYRSGNEAPGLSPCSGLADMELVVNPKPGAKTLAPNRNPNLGGATATSKLFTFDTIDAKQPSGKTTAQDNWSLTPVPTPTKTAK